MASSHMIEQAAAYDSAGAPLTIRRVYVIIHSVVDETAYVCVAQLDRALVYGTRCRGFESLHARVIRAL